MFDVDMIYILIYIYLKNCNFLNEDAFEKKKGKEAQLRRIEISFFTRASQKGDSISRVNAKESLFQGMEKTERASSCKQFQSLKRSEWTVNQREETRPFRGTC